VKRRAENEAHTTDSFVSRDIEKKFRAEFFPLSSYFLVISGRVAVVIFVMVCEAL